jgi:hypothetical protein
MENFIELNLINSRTSLIEIDNQQPYLNHLQAMKTKATGAIKKFKFRIAPHPVLKEEYPERYYKFRNEKVAKAFWLESLGNEIKVKQL